MTTNALTIRIHAAMVLRGYVGDCSIMYPNNAEPVATVTFIVPGHSEVLNATLNMAGKGLPELTEYFCDQFATQLGAP